MFKKIKRFIDWLLRREEVIDYMSMEPEQPEPDLNKVNLYLTDDSKPFHLDKMAHLLIAGQTGSGKSTLLKRLLNQLIHNHEARDVKLLLIDPKMVELIKFAKYKDHLVGSIKNKVKDIYEALDSIWHAMLERYSLMQALEATNLDELNFKLFDKVPPIVIVIDEFNGIKNDEKYGKKITTLVRLISEQGRAAGYHLILCTQHPSVKVIPQEIKANLISRVGLKTQNAIQSRAVIDESGLEKIKRPGVALAYINGWNDNYEKVVIPFEESKRYKCEVCDEQFWESDLYSGICGQCCMEEYGGYGR